MSRTTGRVELTSTTIAGAGTTLLVMGLVAAAYGPLLPYFMRRFSIDLPAAGLVFGVNFAGAFMGVIASMVALTRVETRLLVSTSVASLALGCAGLAIAPTWPATLAAIFVVGLGYGALDLGINQMLAYSVNPERVGLLNGLNGVYGIGAVAAPLLVSLAAGRYGGLYGGVVLIAIGALLAIRRLAGSLVMPPSYRVTWSTKRVTAIFALAVGLYVGVEVGVAGWMPTHLHAVGYGLTQANAVTSGFWFALAAGRFLIAPISMRVGDVVIVLTAIVVAIFTLLLALVTPLAPVAYILTGLLIAPIFPTAVAWLARINPANPAATSWLFPASMVGGALIPTTSGILMARIGAAWAPALFALVAAASAVAFTSVRRNLSPASEGG